jgi:hypothetical protein
MLVVAVQHLFGLLMASGLYARLRGYGIRRALAALAVAPVLLDAYQVQIEQNIMSDTLFETLVVAGLLLLLAIRRRDGAPPSARRAVLLIAAAGVVLGSAVVVRAVGLILIVPALLFALFALTGPWLWRRLLVAGALCAAFAVPVLGYATYYHHVAGTWALSDGNTSLEYGRAAVIADCTRDHLPSYELHLCPIDPPSVRRWLGVDYYAHNFAAPSAWVLPAHGLDASQLLTDFAHRVFLAQPGDLTVAVAHDAVKLFAPSRMSSPGDPPISRWQFQNGYPTWPYLYADKELHGLGYPGPHTNAALARILRHYQLGGGYTPGPLLALCLLAAAAATLFPGRTLRRSPLRAPCALVLGTSALLLLGADFFEFSWRYQLPGIVLLPIAGVLGVTLLCGRYPAARDRVQDHPPTRVHSSEVNDLRS